MLDSSWTSCLNWSLSSNLGSESIGFCLFLRLLLIWVLICRPYFNLFRSWNLLDWAACNYIYFFCASSYSSFSNQTFFFLLLLALNIFFSLWWFPLGGLTPFNLLEINFIYFSNLSSLIFVIEAPWLNETLCLSGCS